MRYNKVLNRKDLETKLFSEYLVRTGSPQSLAGLKNKISAHHSQMFEVISVSHLTTHPRQSQKLL